MNVRIATDGDGYEEIRVDCGRLYHHRLLAFAWDEIDSVFFSDDMQEVHHENGMPWDNRESNLSGMTPEEHQSVDPGRARIRTPWS